jgi:thimet oligopeptidase
LQDLADYGTSLILNESLYRALKNYTQKSFSTLKPNEQKFLSEQILIFENNGMKLHSSGRKELQSVSNKITYFGLAFEKNIGSSRDSIIFSAAELAGVPENEKKGWETESGKYLVYINTPNHMAIRSNADLDSTRRRMYFRYNNRAYPQNMLVLDSLLYYRNLYAKKLGYRSYAAYALTTKMAETPENVWKFQNNLIQKLAPFDSTDLASIRTIKHAMHPELPDTIYLWDIEYYKKKLLDSKYNLNEEEVRAYFEMDQTINGMFEVYHRLLGITVKETSGVPTWYYKVRTFDMFLGDKKIGSFYFDLYPRQNKYTHFACFGISSANTTAKNEILPVAALICNFPEPAAKDEPTLLSHSDLKTLFHEFGHLVHFMVVRSNLASQPNTLKLDFVEAPSQFLENFCWRYESLKIFAKDYKTGAVLPESLFDKLKSTEHVLDANYYMRQLWLGVMDMTFEDKYDSIQGMNLGDVEKSIYHITQIPFQDGTHSITSFTHLYGYGANYYGYLWSRVFAQDIFSVFEKSGVMDSKTGERYRKQILEVAGSEQEMDMLRNFLGREPNSDAFMKSLGL